MLVLICDVLSANAIYFVLQGVGGFTNTSVPKFLVFIDDVLTGIICASSNSLTKIILRQPNTISEFSTGFTLKESNNLILPI